MQRCLSQWVSMGEMVHEISFRLKHSLAVGGGTKMWQTLESSLLFLSCYYNGQVDII